MAKHRAALTRSAATLGALTVIVMLAAVLAPVAAQEGVPAPSNGPVALSGPPEILRGSVAPSPAVEPAAGSSEQRIAAGDRVWFVDQDARRLTGCRLIGTSLVNVQRIQCTERRLPRGAVVRD